MALTVHSDPDRPAGGHAILGGVEIEDVGALTFENVFSGQFLGGDGRWVKQPHAFPVNGGPGPGSLRLGPEIVDAIATDQQLALRSGDGRYLGRVFWTDVAPSRSRRSPAPAPPPATFESPPSPSAEEVAAPPAPPPPIPPLPRPEAIRAPTLRRRDALVALAVALLAATAGGAGLLAWQSRTDVPQTRDSCAVFAPNPATSAGDGDEARLRRAEQALAAGCGTAAFDSLDEADWRQSEPAAWYLARFYDPNESDPIYRRSARVHPAWAATYYRRWADRSPRQATALATLCRAAGQPDAEAGLAQVCAP